jgi:hypothetical protein
MKTALPPKIKNARAFIRTAPFALASSAEEVNKSFTESPSRMTGEKGKTRIMWIERKAGALQGDARIGRVSFSKTGRTLYYRGRKFQSLKGDGFKSNYFDVESGENYWISGPKRNGQDALYGGGGAEIDEDCREEYWTKIRGAAHLTGRGIS